VLTVRWCSTTRGIFLFIIYVSDCLKQVIPGQKGYQIQHSDGSINKYSQIIIEINTTSVEFKERIRVPSTFVCNISLISNHVILSWNLDETSSGGTFSKTTNCARLFLPNCTLQIFWRAYTDNSKPQVAYLSWFYKYGTFEFE